MNYEVMEALNQIAQEKNVDKGLVIETLKVGLQSAAKKRYGGGDNIEVEVDPDDGKINIFAVLEVVEDPNEAEDPLQAVSLARAQEIDPKAEIGSTVRETLNVSEFGRNAIQTAKQILVQRVREAERDRIFDDFQARIGEIITGTVQQVSRGEVYVNLGRTEAVLPLKEQIRKEKYRQGDTIRAYVSDVLKTTKGPQVVISRTHPKFLEKLFQFEVPEIYEGLVEIKSVAREPGERSKIAVASKEERIDPVGACVGMKGSRVQAIVRELSNERIDIVPWNEDEAMFLSRALSPAKVVRVAVDRKEHRMAALVQEDQLSLAIGKSGQNARLASQLTGWHIDILTEEEYQERVREKQATRVPLEELSDLEESDVEKLKAVGVETANELFTLALDDLTETLDIDEETAETIIDSAGDAVSTVVEAYRAEVEAERAAREAEEAAAEAERLEKEANEAAEAPDVEEEEGEADEGEVQASDDIEAVAAAGDADEAAEAPDVEEEEGEADEGEVQASDDIEAVAANGDADEAAEAPDVEEEEGEADEGEVQASDDIEAVAAAGDADEAAETPEVEVIEEEDDELDQATESHEENGDSLPEPSDSPNKN